MWKIPSADKAKDSKNSENKEECILPLESPDSQESKKLVIPSTQVETKQKLEVAEIEGIPKNMILILGGNPYVMKAGLLYRMDKVFGKRKYSVRAIPIKGTWEGDPKIAVYKGVVEIKSDDGSNVTFEDIGVAKPENVVNPKMHTQLDHLASTRATNRAMRLALAFGYCSVEELPEVKEVL